jgi:hypothetical protein
MIEAYPENFFRDQAIPYCLLRIPIRQVSLNFEGALFNQLKFGKLERSVHGPFRKGDESEVMSDHGIQQIRDHNRFSCLLSS